MVHKSDDHEITEKLIVAIVSEDHKYDHENENTAAGLSYLNVADIKESCATPRFDLCLDLKELRTTSLGTGLA